MVEVCSGGGGIGGGGGSLDVSWRFGLRSERYLENLKEVRGRWGSAAAMVGQKRSSQNACKGGMGSGMQRSAAQDGRDGEGIKSRAEPGDDQEPARSNVIKQGKAGVQDRRQHAEKRPSR